jgi:hypothetical protein
MASTLLSPHASPFVPPSTATGLQEASGTQPSTPLVQSCKHCGGSGILRVSDLSHRTCMDCLGQGKLTAASAAAWPLAGFSAAVCAAGAR